MLVLWFGYWDLWIPPSFSIYYHIRWHKPSGIIRNRFIIKIVQLGVFNWSIKLLIILKEICWFNNIILDLSIYGLNTQTFSMLQTSITFATIQTVHQTSQQDQFWKKLQHKFKNIYFNLLTRTPSPSLDTYLNELLWEEHRCMT